MESGCPQGEVQRTADQATAGLSITQPQKFYTIPLGHSDHQKRVTAWPHWKGRELGPIFGREGCGRIKDIF
jgi:hypothetical protein